MLLHPSLIMFYITLMLSITLVFSSTSWFMLWMSLELNFMSFIPLILKKKNKYSVESALKYFLNQAISSMIILLGVFMSKSNLNSLTVIILGLLMKLGAAPSHQWLPATAESLSWPNMYLLLVVQKLAPLSALSFLSSDSPLVIIMYISLSAMVSSLAALTDFSVRKIMVYSSITQMAWLLLAILLMNWTWFSYMLVYASILAGLFVIFNKMELVNLHQMYFKMNLTTIFLMASAMLSLGGLPPFAGFFMKLLLMMPLMSTKPLIYLTAILLLSSLINLMNYFSIFWHSFFISYTKNFMYSNINYLKLYIINLMTLIIVPTFVLF